MTRSSATEASEPEPYDIVVIGAGIAGLVAGVSAAEGGARVAIVDQHSPGGRARTTVRDGVSYNQGPHALYLGGHLRPFLAERKIDPPGGIPDAKHLRLLRGGELWPLTVSPLGIARTKLLSPRSRIRIMRLMATLPRKSTAEFVGTPWAEWLGNEPDDVAGLIRMLVRTGTYVDAPERFDAAAALDQLKLALVGVRYIDRGWQTIVDSLSARFTSLGGQLLADRTVLSVESDGDVRIATSTDPMTARAAIIAGPGPDVVERLTDAQVAGRANAGGEVHASALDLALDRPHPGLVFGIDEPLYLSPHGPTARMTAEGAGLVSVMRYTPEGEVGGPSPDAVRTRLRGLAEMAGIDAGDVTHERYLHRVVVANSFPTAAGGGLAGRPAVDALGLGSVFIAGDWIGPRFQLADAASASGEAAAKRALALVAGGARVGV